MWRRAGAAASLCCRPPSRQTEADRSRLERGRCDFPSWWISGATMCPVLLLLLLLPAALRSDAPPEGSAGLNFVISFPENIAYYHPVLPQNKIRATALYNDTNVQLRNSWGNPIESPLLSAGHTWEHQLGPNVEIMRGPMTEKKIIITGTKKIIVQATNLRSTSMQTTLVTPTDKLGTEYLIPPIPTIEGTTHPADWVTTAVAERQPFKLVIINTDAENKVLVDGEVPQNMTLSPRQAAQVLLTQSHGLRWVKAEQPVAVLFGHTCAMRHNCTCGQLSTMLPPATQDTLKFYIPPDLAEGAEDKTLVLVSERESTQVKAFDPDSPLVETAGSAVLYRPGLLLSLLPETHFGSCFLIHSVAGAENYAVIMVHKDSKGDVHLGRQSLASQHWHELTGQEYVSTTVPLQPDKNVLWHASSTMAVYFLGKKEGSLFGNPAAVISKTPDFRGCPVTPEVVTIGEVADGWPEAVEYCKNQSSDLISFPEKKLQTQIYRRILQIRSAGLRDVWIGMRRSSMTGEWYWLSGEAVDSTNWAEGEPGGVDHGQCVMMSVEGGKDFGWRDEHCCKAAHPVCYRQPRFLPL